MSRWPLTERLFAWLIAGDRSRAAGAAKNPAPAPPFSASRKRSWTLAGVTTFLSGLGGFFAISGCIHLVAVGVIATVPIHFTPNLEAKRKRHANVDTEIKPEARAAFDFVAPTQVRLPKGWGKPIDETSPDQQRQQRRQFQHEPDTAPAAKPPRRQAAEAEEAGGEADAEASAAALAAALTWFVRHQEADGSWTLNGFERQCQGAACGGAGSLRSPAAATGLALTPLIGAVDNRAAAAAFEDTIVRGVRWLLQHQRPDGDLSARGDQRLYSHAVAGIALCRRYAALREPEVGAALQWAIKFSLAAQDAQTGGWSYEPGGRGNTSSVAWQLMFLQAAHGVGLQVDPICWRRADAWMRSMSRGDARGLFAYEPGRKPTPSMTAVGLEYLRFRGMRNDHPAMIDGHALMLSHPPDSVFEQDVFYWFLGAPAARNFGSGDWLPWQRRMRRALVETQAIEGCNTGSWSPSRAAPELWSAQAGRLMITSFAAQLLEAESVRPPPTAPAEQSPLASAPSGSVSR